MNESWYYLQGQQVFGPIDRNQILNLIREGRIVGADSVRRESNGTWRLARDYRELGMQPPDIAGSSAVPPLASDPRPTGSTSPKPTQKELPQPKSDEPVAVEPHPAEYVGYFLSRIVRSDFSTISATDHERAVLDATAEPIKLGIAQDYVAWRRSVLTVATVLFFINACFGWKLNSLGYDYLHGWGYAVYLFFKIVLLGSQWIGLSILIYAALEWEKLRTSVSAARAAWLLTVLVPMVLFMLPLERFMGLNPTEKGFIATSFAVACFQWLFPKVIGLFPGLIRCCMTLKSLLPESAALGWVVLIIAPLYGMILLVAFAISVHSAQTFLTPCAFALLALGPFIYVLNYRTLVRSHDEQEGRRLIQSIRTGAIVVTVAGIGILAIKVKDMIELQEWRPTVLDVIHLLTGVFANILLLTVVGADFILAVMRRTHEQQQTFHGSGLQAAMVTRFRALTDVGLSDWLGEETPRAATDVESHRFTGA